MRSPVLGWSFGLLILLGWMPSGEAQDVAGCNNLNQTEGAKIVLGSMEYEAPDGEVELLTKTRQFLLRMEFQSRLDNLFEVQNDPKGVLCSARKPEDDGSTFTEAYVEALDEREVLMEIWGTLRADVQDGEERFEAELSMMVFPIELQPMEGVPATPSFHNLFFPAAERGGVDEVLRQTTFGAEFEIYALLGRAVKRFRNRAWDDAQGLLSRARLLFENARASHLLAQTLTDEDQVAAYMTELEEAIESGAASDPTYEGDLVEIASALEGGGP